VKELFATVLRTFLLMSCKLVTGVQARWLAQPNNFKTKIY